ncbi:MAG: hypothetical protein WA053_00780, partial [Minisyncoccia bacterium]
MMKKALFGAAVLGLFAASALPAFAENGENEGRKNQNATTTAAVATAIAQKIVCVGTAVNARETTLGTAVATLTAAQNAAYTARAAALKLAYTLTTAKEVRAASNTAWRTFNNSMKTARKAWQTVRGEAWQTFRKA